MSSAALPSLLTSPALLTWNGKSFFSKTGIRAAFHRQTFKISTDFDGVIDERMKSQLTEITFQPDGQAADPNQFFPYDVTDIGKSVFGTSPKPLVIITKFGGDNNAGQTITYPRAAVTRFPQLRLKTADTLFGPMSFCCPGNPNVQPNSPNAWETVASATFADSSFDESKIITDTYTASYGNSPYDRISALDGFEVDFVPTLAPIDADDFGHLDLVLKSLSATARFAPTNLSHEQVVALLNHQGANYVFPGQSPATSGHDLVITGSGNNSLTLTVTVKNAAPKSASFLYSTSRHRFESLEFTAKRTWTSGAPNPLWTLAIT